MDHRAKLGKKSERFRERENKKERERARDCVESRLQGLLALLPI